MVLEGGKGVNNDLSVSDGMAGIIVVSDSVFQRSLIFAGGGIALALLLLAGSNDAYACEVLSLPSAQEAVSFQVHF